MILHLILGINIDTPLIVEKLSTESNETIAVIDYDLKEGYRVTKDVTIISVSYAKNYIKGFSGIVFHKSLYVYPLVR